MLSKKALNIKPSATLAITAKAKELKTMDKDIISFSVGEPDFKTPLFIREAAKNYIDRGHILYTDASGTPTLKQTICNKFNRQNGLTYTPKQIIVSSGAKQSIYNACQALLNEGDEVIIPVPYWVSYPEMVTLNGGVPVFIEAKEENGFKITAEDLQKAITSKTKLLIFNSPSNPTGAMYQRQDLEELAGVIEQYDNLYVLSDEIYEELSFDNSKMVSIASISDTMYKKTIVINGVSKAYAMTGWRIGYAAGDETIIKAMANIQSHSSSNPNTIAQYATEVALSGDQSFIGEMVNEFEKRRDYIVAAVNDIQDISCIKPGGAFYVMVNCTKLYKKMYRGEAIGDSKRLSRILLEEAGLATVPGAEFGADDFIRMSYATSIELIEAGVKRLKTFVESL